MMKILTYKSCNNISGYLYGKSTKVYGNERNNESPKTGRSGPRRLQQNIFCCPSLHHIWRDMPCDSKLKTILKIHHQPERIHNIILRHFSIYPMTFVKRLMIWCLT